MATYLVVFWRSHYLISMDRSVQQLFYRAKDNLTLSKISESKILNRAQIGWNGAKCSFTVSPFSAGALIMAIAHNPAERQLFIA
ncbi:hypothetical protein PspS34_14045 [Pseudomonas sp. S34]|nr:hypothetical protein PspS34_14045 [Pseudomonas sp. S34]